MARNLFRKPPPIGGYNYRFVTEPPDSLKCLICLSVARDPQQHTECGKLFCKSCLQEYLRQTSPPRDSTCPGCRGPGLTTFKDARSALEVNSLQVRCRQKECPWTGDLCNVQSHHNKCGYASVPCPKSCGDIIQRRLLEEHNQSKCPKRLYMCPHCSEVGEYGFISAEHLESCPKIKITCQNEGCIEEYFRCESEEHESKCEFKLINCKYEEFGCDYKVIRRDMKKHEEDTQLHVELMRKKVLTLTRQVENNQTECTFQLTSYQELKKNGSTFWSPKFYSHKNGYRLRISIEPDGDEEYKHTHLAVFSYLMKGEFDNQLKWPFSGTVKIELLNQQEDDNHFVHSLSNFPADNKSVSGRPGVNGNQGWGKPAFISNTELESGHYLVDDRLVFRVSVEVPDYKPWLQCNH